MSRMMIAALTMIGAASFAAAPSFAQTSGALKIQAEADAPPAAGVAPVVSPLKGVTPSKLNVQSGAVRGAVRGATDKLELLPENQLPAQK
jgi:hypothetical protein